MSEAVLPVREYSSLSGDECDCLMCSADIIMLNLTLYPENIVFLLDDYAERSVDGL